MSKSAESTAFTFTRAGKLELNPTLLRQRTSAALSDLPDGSSFITIREGAGLGHYVVLHDDFSAERSAFAIAKSVAAVSKHAEVPDLSLTHSVAQLKYERGSIAGNNTQVGADLQAVADVAASSLRDGEWVGFSIRRPTKAENKRNRKWLEHRGSLTHHSLEVNAVVVSMWAGADSAESARGILRRIAGALPGFDLRTQTNSVSGMRDSLPYLGGAAVAALAGFVGTTIVDIPSAFVLYFVAGVAGVLAVLAGRGILPTRARRVRRLMARGIVPLPPHRVLPPKPPKRATMDKTGNNVPAYDGEYPLHETAFVVGSATPVTLVAPHAGAESGGQGTQERIAPPVLREAIGPLVGLSDGTPAYLSAADMWAGLMALGEAGSGKSALLQAMWGYDAAVKMGQLTTPDGHGRMHTMIAFDTKNDSASAEQYVAWSEAAGDTPIRIDFSDESSPLGIELFATTGSAMNRARRLASALKYVFGEVSIGYASFETLSAVFVGAFAATPTIVAEVPGLEAGRSPFYYANVLLTSRGDDLGKRLADALRIAGDNGDTDAREATEIMSSLYDPKVTTAKRADITRAPRNKIEQLVAAEQWWSRPKRASWKSLLERNTSVVINFGSVGGHMADEELSSQVAALMMYTLREEIQRNCIGWFEQKRMVSIYADELKHISGSNSSVVSWIRNDARSFGARAVFATQFPRQLDPEVRSTVMGFGTLVCYSQGDSGVIDEVITSLKADDSEWSRADIFSLPKFTAIVRTTFDQEGQTAFTAVVPDFRSMRGEEFLRAQGAQGAIVVPETASPLGPLNAVYQPERDAGDADLGHNYRLPSPDQV